MTDETVSLEVVDFLMAMNRWSSQGGSHVAYMRDLYHFKIYLQ